MQINLKTQSQYIYTEVFLRKIKPNMMCFFFFIINQFIKM